MASTTAPRPPPPPPPPPSGGVPSTDAVETPSKSNPACQLEAAADLIRSLDAAYTEMSHHAADAAKDAEMARRNSRAASEIARRFMNPRSIATPLSPTSKLLGMQWGNNNHSSTAGGDGSVPTHSTPPRIQRTPYSPLSKSITDAGSPLARQNWNGFLANSTTPQIENLRSAASTSPSRTITATATRSRMHQAYSTTERIAQSHAEDVLALSMELERCKQALKSEKRMHADTKATMAGHKEAAERLEQERIKLADELEQTKLQASQQRQELEYELHTAKHLVQAAEEDALVALELAKGNSEKQHELESELHATKEELARLKAASSQPHSRVPPPPPSPKRVVRFADEQVLPATPAPPVSPPPVAASTPSRNMVATGRQLLRRSRITSPQEEVIQLELTPAKAAERRQQLRNKLAQLEQETKLATPAKASSTLTSPEKRSPSDPSLTMTAIGRLIHDSGKRLALQGPHWSRPGASATQDVEAMTRSYCQLVEGRIGTQRQELNQLESLCGFLEQKLVMGSQ